MKTSRKWNIRKQWSIRMQRDMSVNVRWWPLQLENVEFEKHTRDVAITVSTKWQLSYIWGNGWWQHNICCVTLTTQTLQYLEWHLPTEFICPLSIYTASAMLHPAELLPSNSQQIHPGLQDRVKWGDGGCQWSSCSLFSTLYSIHPMFTCLRKALLHSSPTPKSTHAHRGHTRARSLTKMHTYMHACTQTPRHKQTKHLISTISIDATIIAPENHDPDDTRYHHPQRYHDA